MVPVGRRRRQLASPAATCCLRLTRIPWRASRNTLVQLRFAPLYLFVRHPRSRLRGERGLWSLSAAAGGVISAATTDLRGFGAFCDVTAYEFEGTGRTLVLYPETSAR